jgi:hypothetical protein
LCARGEEELVVGSAKDAAGVGVDIEVNELGVVCSADGDEGVELDAGRAFKGSEHSVGVGVIEGNYIVGVIGGGVAFFVEYDEGTVRCRFELGGGEGEVISEVVGCGEDLF